jgi:hypothetical protein
MTSAEIFYERVVPRGGRFPRDLVPEAVRKYYDSIEADAQFLINSAREVVSNVPDVHVDFVLNGNINALAFRSGDQYFIGIYTGTIFMLNSMIGRMLSDARLFLYAGDAGLERTDLEPLTDYTPNADVMYQKRGLFAPKDKARRDYAAFLQHHAIMFLVGHELTHILHGHVDYLSVKRGAKITAELALLDSTDEEELLERQCLEFDADRRSITSRIDSLRMTLKSGATQIVTWRPNQEAEFLLMFDWAISINILFRLFGDKRFRIVDPIRAAYPPLPVRQLACFASAIEAVDLAWDPNLKSAAKKVLGMALRETEVAFAITLGEDFNGNPMGDHLSQADSDHLKKIAKYFATTVAERLKPYAYERP